MNFNILSIFKNIKLTDIVSTANKTLNIVKKSIPVYKEIRPFVTKEKTIFKNSKDENINDIYTKEKIAQKSKNYNENLTFFE